jgi:hypothetical protein
MILAATVAIMLQTFIMRENAAASVEIAVMYRCGDHKIIYNNYFGKNLCKLFMIVKI